MASDKLILHACCAPCLTYPYEVLSQSFRVKVLFYNPNIYPSREYFRRADEIKRYSASLSIPTLTGPWEPQRFMQLVEGLEHIPEGGKRCQKCFLLRLQVSAETCLREGIKLFTTTLTVSPHKNADMINSIGTRIAQECNLTFVEANFKKKDGFKKSVEMSRAAGLFRQNYCGCLFSQIERERRLASKHQAR